MRNKVEGNYVCDVCLLMLGRQLRGAEVLAQQGTQLSSMARAYRQTLWSVAEYRRRAIPEREAQLQRSRAERETQLEEQRQRARERRGAFEAEREEFRGTEEAQLRALQEIEGKVQQRLAQRTAHLQEKRKRLNEHTLAIQKVLAENNELVRGCIAPYQDANSEPHQALRAVPAYETASQYRPQDFLRALIVLSKGSLNSQQVYAIRQSQSLEIADQFNELLQLELQRENGSFRGSYRGERKGNEPQTQENCLCAVF